MTSNLQCMTLCHTMQTSIFERRGKLRPAHSARRMNITWMMCSTTQGFPHKAVEWHSTTLLLSKSLKVVYKECKKPLIFHYNGPKYHSTQKFLGNLCNCHTAKNIRRYNECHDQVLSTTTSTIKKHLSSTVTMTVDLSDGYYPPLLPPPPKSHCINWSLTWCGLVGRH